MAAIMTSTSIGRLLTYTGATFFVVYGLLFSALPGVMFDLVTGAVPVDGSVAIDLRATYGGMTVALGVVLFWLGRADATVPAGVLAVLITMVCMAATRTIGIVLDGGPNAVMYVYLGLELLGALLCLVWVGRGSQVRE